MSKNIAASVRQRLLNRSRETGEDYNLLLTRYGNERLLYRLSVSPHALRFVLKGALLFTAWTGTPVARPATLTCSAAATRRRRGWPACSATCANSLSGTTTAGCRCRSSSASATRSRPRRGT